MLVLISGGTYVGFKLDQMYPNSHSFFTLIFSLTSIVLSIYYIIKQVAKND